MVRWESRGGPLESTEYKKAQDKLQLTKLFMSTSYGVEWGRGLFIDNTRDKHQLLQISKQNSMGTIY